MLYSLSRKRFWRSNSVGKSIVVKLLLGFSFLYFASAFAALGWFFDGLAEELQESKSVFPLINKVIYYYLLVDLIIRVLFQEVKEIQFQQLCLLPIKKSTIVHHILSSTIVSIFNITPFFFILPFTINYLVPEFGILFSICWVIAVAGLLLFNNYLAMLIKNRIAGKPVYYPVLVGIVSLLWFLQYGGWLPLFYIVGVPLDLTLAYGAPFALFILAAFVAYKMIFKRMLGRAYLSSGQVQGKGFLSTMKFEGLHRYGAFGIIAQLNLRLFTRNKRIRTQLIFTLLMVLFGGFYFYNEETMGPGFTLFFGMFLTGGLMLSVSPYLWSYQAGYLEALLSWPIPKRTYITQQFNFYILLCVITALPGMMYYFYYPESLYFNISAFLFNIGVNIPIMLFISFYHKEKIEINSSGTFNMQGINGLHYLSSALVFLIPIFTFLPFNAFGRTSTGLMVIGCIGIIGLLCRPLWIHLFMEMLSEKKYRMVENFRSKS